MPSCAEALVEPMAFSARGSTPPRRFRRQGRAARPKAGGSYQVIMDVGLPDVDKPRGRAKIAQERLQGPDHHAHRPRRRLRDADPRVEVPAPTIMLSKPFHFAVLLARVRRADYGDVERTRTRSTPSGRLPFVHRQSFCSMQKAPRVRVTEEGTAVLRLSLSRRAEAWCRAEALLQEVSSQSSGVAARTLRTRASTDCVRRSKRRRGPGRIAR